MFSFGFKFLYFFRQQSLFMDEKGNSTVVVGIGSSYGKGGESFKGDKTKYRSPWLSFGSKLSRL